MIVLVEDRSNKSLCDFNIECPDRSDPDFERTPSVVACCCCVAVAVLCCVLCTVHGVPYDLRQAAVLVRFAHRFDVSVREFRCKRRACVSV